jgi:hypothetical protein
MVLHRNRSLLLGLGLAVALVLAVALPATASAVSTLTGEKFNASGGPLGVACQTDGPYSYTASGTATGPYPGTFTETGSGTVTAGPQGVSGSMTLSASFTIHSGDFLITGSKSGGVSGPACQDTSGNTGGSVNGLSYRATIHTSTGNYADQGTSNALVFTGPSGTSLLEDFASSLFSPTSKDQCKNNGWKAFPQFKNQGECVSFVERQRQT